MKEYYKKYKSLHTDKACIMFHFYGHVFTLGTALYLILTQLWWFLPLVLFISYPFAWLGHYLFEKNEPAAFHDPVKAKIASWMMFWDVIRGKIKIF